MAAVRAPMAAATAGRDAAGALDFHPGVVPGPDCPRSAHPAVIALGVKIEFRFLVRLTRWCGREPGPPAGYCPRATDTPRPLVLANKVGVEDSVAPLAR